MATKPLSQASVTETTLASAGTTDIGAASSMKVAISGTTTITSFGTTTNRLRFLRFTGAMVLTYNATSLILPTSANITTVDGDRAIAMSDASGNWRVWSYTRANGNPLAIDSPTVTGTQSMPTSIVTSYHIDSSDATFTIADTSSVNLPVASGAFIINDNTSGKTALVLLGGGAVVIAAQTATEFVNTDAGANTRIFYNGTTNYVIKNSNGSGTKTYSVWGVKVRNSN